MPQVAKSSRTTTGFRTITPRMIFKTTPWCRRRRLTFKPIRETNSTWQITSVATAMPTYRRYEERLRIGYENVGEQGQEAADEELERIMEQVKQDVYSGRLRPYVNKEVGQP